MSNIPDNYISIKNAGSRLRRSHDFVYKQILKGNINALKIKKGFFISAEQFQILKFIVLRSEVFKKIKILYVTAGKSRQAAEQFIDKHNDKSPGEIYKIALAKFSPSYRTALENRQIIQGLVNFDTQLRNYEPGVGSSLMKLGSQKSHSSKNYSMLEYRIMSEEHTKEHTARIVKEENEKAAQKLANLQPGKG